MINIVIDWTWHLVMLAGGLVALTVLCCMASVVCAVLIDIMFPNILNRRIEKAQEEPTRVLHMHRIHRVARPDRARWADLIHPPKQAGHPEAETIIMDEVKIGDDEWAQIIKEFHDNSK